MESGQHSRVLNKGMDFGQSFDLQTTVARRKKKEKKDLSQKDYQNRQLKDIRTEKFSWSSDHVYSGEGLES